MEEKILVNLSTDHIFESATNIIGREGEGNTSRLEINIPEILCGCSVYLDFEKPNGEKLRTPKLKVENGVTYYDVVPYLLTDEGEIKVQAVLLTASGGTWKSSIKKYINQHSINGLEEIPEIEDFMTEAQRVLDELSQEVEEIAELLSNDQDFINTVVNTIEDARWVNTITGQRLRFFVGTQAEYDALTDTENLFAIITDDTAKEEIAKAIETNATNIEGNATAIEENANAIATNKTDIATNKSGIATNKSSISSLNTSLTNHTKHNFSLLCSVSLLGGGGRLAEANATKLKNTLCLMVFEESLDSGTFVVHTGLINIHNDINKDSGVPSVAIERYQATCGEFSLRYNTLAGNTADNITLFKNGSASNAGGTLKFYKIGTV